MSNRNHKEISYNLHKGLMRIYWDNFKQSILTKKDNPTLSRRILEDLAHLKYLDEGRASHVAINPSWDQWLHRADYQTLIDLHMIKSSVVKNRFDDNESFNQLTRFGRQYANYALPDEPVHISNDEVCAIKHECHEEHHLTTDYAWRYEYSLIGFIVGILTWVGLELIFGVGGGFLIENGLTKISAYKLNLVELLIFIIATLISVIIGASSTNSIFDNLNISKGHSHQQYMTRLEEAKQRHWQRTLDHGKGTEKDFIRFLTKNNRWKLCFQQPSYKVFQDIGHQMFQDNYL